jgi:hypothetical protein
MSYMNHSAAFAPVGGIEELTLDEASMANGGLPMLVPVVIALYGTQIAYGAGVAAGAGLVLYAALSD